MSLTCPERKKKKKVQEMQVVALFMFWLNNNFQNTYFKLDYTT